MVLPSLMHQLPAEVILGKIKYIVLFPLDCLLIYISILYKLALDLHLTICIFASVSDLLDYINPDEELKARELQKKLARAKVQPFYFPFYVNHTILTSNCVLSFRRKLTNGTCILDQRKNWS